MTGTGRATTKQRVRGRGRETAGDGRDPRAHVIDLDVAEQILQHMIDPLRDVEVAAADGPGKRTGDGHHEPGGADALPPLNDGPRDRAARERKDRPGDQSEHRSGSEIHVFVIWSRARNREQAILDDLRVRFEVLRAVEVTWRRARFSENLTRFYGQKLPSRSQKERHCGTGPFLLVVVRDTASEYATRGGRNARVNVRTWEARERYRAWTGGGHRVHASLDREEADHDLYLLLGVLAADVAVTRWGGAIETIERDLVGSAGWGGLSQLLTALSLTVRWVAIGGSPDVVPAPLASVDGARTLVLVVDDEWAAYTTLLGRRRGSVAEVDVAGRPFWVEVRSIERARGDAVLQRALDRRIRDGDLFIPSNDDLDAVVSWQAKHRGRTPGAILRRLRR